MGCVLSYCFFMLFFLGKSSLRKQEGTCYTGKVDYVSPRFAYVVVEGLAQDIYVPYAALLGSCHGDSVKVLVPREQRGERPEGKVLSIISRGRSRVAGKLVRHKAGRAVAPTHKKWHQPILLRRADDKVALGDKVLVDIVRWPTTFRIAEGRLNKHLGPSGSYEAETQTILSEYELPDKMPDKVNRVAEAIGEEISAPELARRRDFRAWPTFTVDPVDAKDFDDALSVKVLGAGRYEVAIHIADVSHYVAEGDPVDQEAKTRGTSVYLVGRTLPMLPEHLSNDLCSLRPDRDRLAFSMSVVMDEQGQVQDMWLGESVIHSKRRFTYQEAQKLIDGEVGDYAQELTVLDRLAKVLRQERIKRGAIAFQTSDVSILLDLHNQPLSIVPKVTSSAHEMVEEWMLLTNRLVAEKICKQQAKTTAGRYPLIYRVHDKPEMDKVARLRGLAKQLGYKFDPQEDNLPAHFNQLLQAISQKPDASILQMHAIRTMSQALYTTVPKGHFGLGFRYYTHFTSPIRRYVDLVVHRLVKKYLSGQPRPKQVGYYEEVAQHISARERIAIDAERSSVAYHQVRILEGMQGQVVSGTVMSVTEWGIYVDLTDYRCEGMVKLASLKDDYYVLDSQKFAVVGQRQGKHYGIGDRVNVRLEAFDLERRTIDLAFAT